MKEVQVIIMKLEVTLQLPEWVRGCQKEISDAIHNEFHVYDMDLNDYYPWTRIEINTAIDDYKSVASKMRMLLKKY